MSHVCNECGLSTKPKKVNKGKFIIEIIPYIIGIFLLFLGISTIALLSFIIGFIYTFYRFFSRKLVCSHCGSEKIYHINIFRKGL